MNKDDFYFLGSIIKTHGSDAELVLYLDVDNTKNYNALKSVFIMINNRLIPFFIDKICLKNNNRAVVKFQDVETHQKAKDLINCEVYLPLSSLPSLKGNKFYYHEIIGFKVIDKNFGYIGTIEKIIEQQLQSIMQIKFKDKGILIPIADKIIKKVDRDKKQIEIQAPEGLIEIYI